MNFFRRFEVIPATACLVAIVVLGALAASRPPEGSRTLFQAGAPAAAPDPDMSWTKRIRRAHPRLYFTDESWPDVRRRALTVRADWYARVKTIAGTADGEDWLKIKRPGPLPGSAFDVLDWGARIFAAAFVQRMEPDPARLAEIKALLRASLAYYRAAYAQGREAAWYSLSRAGCFAALDWLGDDFTPAERREIGGGLLAHVRDALHKPGILYRNENGVKTGNYGVDNFAWFAGLALYGEGIDDAAAREALRRGYEVYVKMFEHRAAAAGEDGGGQNKVLGSRIAAFETTDEYAYAAVDATPVYRPEKCEVAIRQFVFVPPHHFAVFDRVTAVKAEYAKRWLLHHANKPEIIGGRAWRSDQAEGRIFCRTLLPEDAVVETVGGAGREFLADGVNYPIDAGPSQERLRNAYPLPRPVYAEVPELMGRWRVEVKPGAARREDVFLHLLEVGGAAETAPAAARRVGDAVELRFESGARTVTILFATHGAVAAEIKIRKGD